MKLLLRLKDFCFGRYESGTQEPIGPSCEMTASKLKYFNSGRKLRRWKTRRCKRVAHIAPPQTRRPGKYRIYRSHTRLYVDFSWDSVAQKNSFAFGVNAPLVVCLRLCCCRSSINDTCISPLSERLCTRHCSVLVSPIFSQRICWDNCHLNLSLQFRDGIPK